MHRTHRVAWELAFGPIPEGLWVLHHCDNPPCVRPDHLFLGTNLDNVQDKCRKGRGAVLSGVLNGRAKLSDEKVRAIRALRSDGATLTSVAEQFDVSLSVVSRIVNRKTWRHIA
jgi:hypothetical protein